MRKSTKVRIQRALLLLALLIGAAAIIYGLCRFLLLRQAVGLLAAAGTMTAVCELMTADPDEDNTLREDECCEDTRCDSVP